MRFFLAIVLAVIGGIGRGDAVNRLRWAWRLWRDVWRGKRAPTPITRARLAYCELCPLFYHPLKTCGTPFKNKGMGCWCYMPYKSRITTATCWLNDNVTPYRWGWPTTLYGTETL